MPVTEKNWNSTFGGPRNDYAYSVQETSDGGYIIAGVTGSYGTGQLDVWLIKTDSFGNEMWNKTFGGSYRDEARFVQGTSDGGYVIAGVTVSYGVGYGDAWLIKTSSKGREMWNKTFGGAEADEGWSVQETRDGGYVITGYTYSYGAGEKDVWLVKTDSFGNEMWNKTFGRAEADEGWSVQETSDGAYVIAGVTGSYGAGEKDVWLIKTSSKGKEVWKKTFGGPYCDEARFVKETTDGGYIITGYTQSYGAGSYDIWLIKTDSFGNEMWNRTFGGNGIDYGSSVQETSDGGYVIAGATGDYGAGYDDDVWLIKTDSFGNEMWNKTFGGDGSDYGNSVQETSDGGYVIAGINGSSGSGEWDVWLIKVNLAIRHTPLISLIPKTPNRGDRGS